MTFDAKRYLDSLSMHGPSGNLSELESRAVWTELRRRMSDPEPEPELKQVGAQDGTT